MKLNGSFYSINKRENIGQTNLFRKMLEKKLTKSWMNPSKKKSFPTAIPEIRNFYENQIKNLVRKHFFADTPDLPTSLNLYTIFQMQKPTN